MKVGNVIGAIWATRKAECLQGQTFLVVESNGEKIVAADQVGAGTGDKVLLATGTVASKYCMDAPVDAAVVAIVDEKKMSFHEILIAVMAGFALLGALDRILGNKWGLGKEFEEGILAMGSLAMAMIGIVCLAPVLAAVLKPVVVPLYRALGADPAMFAGTLLACDMGGGALAREMTEDPQAALLGGVLTGSMLGATIVFTIPVAMGILKEEDRPAMAKGILCGIVTIPVGVLAGGLTAGFPASMVLRNLIPIVLIAVLIALGLWRAERAMIRGFVVVGKIIVVAVTVGLAAAIWEALTGYALIPGMAPISEGFATVGTIAIILAGAFPLVFVLTKLLRKPLMAVGAKLGINEAATAGLIASLANSIAAFSLVKEMNSRGKVVNIAFAVSAAFVFGDHLGFTAGFAPEMIGPMIVGKLVGGISAAAVAIWLTRTDGNAAK